MNGRKLTSWSNVRKTMQQESVKIHLGLLTELAGLEDSEQSGNSADVADSIIEALQASGRMDVDDAPEDPAFSDMLDSLAQFHADAGLILGCVVCLHCALGWVIG